MNPQLASILFKVSMCLALMAFGAGLMHFYDGIGYDKLKNEYNGFKTEVEVRGRIAKIKSDNLTKQGIKDKKDADEKIDLTRRNLNLALDSLRRQANFDGSKLPAPAPGSKRPELICFDRAEYQREVGEALVRLREGTRILLDEGSKSTVELDGLKSWHQGK